MKRTIYWRVEWHDGDVLAAPALATGWAGIDGKPPTTQAGLSCCRSATALLKYWEPWRHTVEVIERHEPEDWLVEEDRPNPKYAAWCEDWEDIAARLHRVPSETTRVIALLGKEIGYGQDGEPLIQPTEVLLDTIYCELEQYPVLSWLDDANCDDLEDVFRNVEPMPNSELADGEYSIGGWLCARMTAEQAERWNAGDLTEEDDRTIGVYDAVSENYLRLGDAAKIKTFSDSLCEPVEPIE